MLKHKLESEYQAIIETFWLVTTKWRDRRKKFLILPKLLYRKQQRPLQELDRELYEGLTSITRKTSSVLLRKKRSFWWNVELWKRCNFQNWSKIMWAIIPDRRALRLVKVKKNNSCCKRARLENVVEML